MSVNSNLIGLAWALCNIDGTAVRQTVRNARLIRTPGEDVTPPGAVMSGARRVTDTPPRLACSAAGLTPIDRQMLPGCHDHQYRPYCC
jgi:hypothetical protein